MLRLLRYSLGVGVGGLCSGFALWLAVGASGGYGRGVGGRWLASLGLHFPVF